MINPTIISRNLRRIMDEEDVTARMLSEWSGVHINTIYNTANCGYNITARKLHAIAQALRRPMEAFFEEEIK